VKAVARRLDRVEERFGYADGRLKKGLQFVCTRADRRLALDAEACVQILEECGHLRVGKAMSVVMLAGIPDGLDVGQTKAYLREHGAELCGRENIARNR
jgi:hypothetical protein